jgi:hypothetical protein
MRQEKSYEEQIQNPEFKSLDFWLREADLKKLQENSKNDEGLHRVNLDGIMNIEETLPQSQ